MAQQPENRTRLRSLLGNEDGIMAVIFAVLLPVFVVMAALAIDMGYALQKRNMLQVDASAACLAGAGRLMDDGAFDPVNEVVVYATVDLDGDGVPDDGVGAGDERGAVILLEALAYAEKNMPGEEVLALVDVMPGNWDPATRTFTRAGFWNPDELTFTVDPATLDLATMTWGAPNAVIAPLDSCLAITRRAEDGPNNNALPLFLAAAVGLPEVNINTAAIATVGVQTTIGFNGCLMAMNETAEDTFLAFGTADISAYDCDIYINSDDECALAGNGVPVVEVGDEDLPGMIYVVGDYCATNQGVEYNCNLPAGSEETCPDTSADLQIDPYEYMNSDAFKTGSGLGTLQALECGKYFVNNEASGYTNNTDLADIYSNPLHTGLGNFKIHGQTQSELFGGVPTACDPLVDPGPGLKVEDGAGGFNCEVPEVYPADPYFAGNPLVGEPIVIGTKVVIDNVDWSWAWDDTDLGTGRYEFVMEPGAYCGGIEARGFGTVVFEPGDYVLKGKEAVDPPIIGGPNPNEFDLRANVAVEGFNVAFYLADEYIEINWGGEADVALTGRQDVDDPLNGFIFYADPSSLGPHQFRGTPAGGYQGILYLPESEVVFKGTADSDLAQADGTGICTILISDTVYFNGTTAFNASADGCGAFGIPPPGAKLVLRLVH